MIKLRRTTSTLSPRHALSLLCLMTLVLACSCSSGGRKERHLKQADGYFDAAQYEEAAIEYLNVLRYEPDHPHAIRQLGLTYWAAQEFQRAMPFLLATARQNPQDIEVRTKVGAVFLMAREFDRAQEEAYQILDLAPDNLDALLLLSDTARTEDDQAEALELVNQALTAQGDRSDLMVAKANLLNRTGQAADAEAAYLAAIVLAPDDPELVVAQAAFLLNQNRLDEAEAAFERAAELAPTNPSLRFMRAMFYLRTDRRDRAISILRELTDEFPDYQPAAFQLAQIYLENEQTKEAGAVLQVIEKSSPGSLQFGLLKATMQIAEDDRESAKNELQKLVRTYPRSPVARVHLADLLIDESEFGEAVLQLEQALEIDPALHPAKLLLAKANLALGRNAQAIALLEEFRETGRATPESNLLLIAMYARADNVDGAMALIEERLIAAPENADNHVLKAELLLTQGKLAEAEDAFRQALRLQPSHPKAVSRLMTLELRRKQGPAALKLAVQALEQNPEDGRLLFLKARGLLATGDLEAAEKTLEAAVAADPEQIEPYFALCQIFARSGRIPEAEARIAQALEQDPANPQSLMLSALLMDRRKDKESARQQYEKLLEVQPTFVPALNNLAYLYSTEFDDLDRAVELAQRASDRVPQSPYVADTLGWIFWQRNEISYALPLLEKAAAAIPEQPEVQYHVGMARLAAGQQDSAVKALQYAADHESQFPGKATAARTVRALSLTPSLATANADMATLETLQDSENPNSAVQLRLAQALHATGDIDAAVDRLQTLLQDRPAFAPALHQLAWITLNDRKDPDGALSIARRAREAGPEQPLYLDTLGWMALQAGNFEWAQSLSREAVEKQPDSPAALYHRAAALLAFGELPAAEEVLKQVEAAPFKGLAQRQLGLLAAARDPGTISKEQAAGFASQAEQSDLPLPYLFAVARHHDHLGDEQDALARYEGIHRAYPEFLPAILWLAEAYLTDSSRLDDAHALARTARERLPSDPSIASTLGQTSALRGEFGYARNLLEEALAATPDDEQVRIALATSCLHLGDQDAAGTHLNHVVQTSSDKVHKDRAIELLKGLEETP